MILPKRQNPLDWLTQLWNIALGSRIEASKDSWLLGPIGKAGETPEDFTSRLVDETNYRLCDAKLSHGLLAEGDLKGLSLNEAVLDFYLNTDRYCLEAEAHWRPGFSFLGRWGSQLFTRRLMQFQLPDSKGGIKKQFNSQILALIEITKHTSCTLWSRSDAQTNEMIFYGVYSTCTLPSGEKAVKTVFPLPEGNATVVFRIIVHPTGDLELASPGTHDGGPGFYFVVEDSKGSLWKHLLRFFSQSIIVKHEENFRLKADHTMKIWNIEVYKLHYKIHLKESQNVNF